MRITLLAAAALLTATPPASAQTAAPAPPSASLRALAAGYKALTLCSAIFNTQTIGAERTAASIEVNELVGVYPELDPLIRDMPAEIGEFSVAVGWDEAMPRRVARHDQVMGCTIYPVGTPEDAWLRPPMLRELQPQQPWPLGDDDFLRTVAEGRRIEPPSPPALFDVRNRAFGSGYGEGTNTTAVVIVRGQDILSERYAPGFETGTPQRTWSVAKSIAATIVGAAAYRGEVDVSAPAAIANWRNENDPRHAITLDNLLHMASGLTSDSAGNRTDAIYFGGTTVDEQAPAWPLIAAPGTIFRYANNDTLLATLAIAPTFAAHPPREFFASVSMHSTVAETDWRGNYILSSQVWATARDLARFGMLYLNDGVWDGTRILPEGWRTYVSTPSGPQPPGDFGYGASFWLMNRSEGVPTDTIAAFGNRGQYVVIVPSRNIVIVRRGEDPSGTRFDIAAFTRDVLAALE